MSLSVAIKKGGDPAMTPGLERFLRRSAATLDLALARLLASRAGDDAPQLTEAMRYAVLGGGKRLRPALTLLAFRAAGGRGGAALPAAMAVELVHAFSLVHDDLPCLDDSPMRRGRPSVHRRFDQATALLAGDALLALAFELIATPRRTWTRGTGERMVRVLAHATGKRGMVGGQAAERELYDRAPSPKALARVHGLKTGRLFEAAALLGGLAAGARPAMLGALAEYARPLGLAFQIADDLLDHAEDGARTQDTYPGVLGAPGAQKALRQAESAAVHQGQALGGSAGRLAVDLAHFAAGRRG